MALQIMQVSERLEICLFCLEPLIWNVSQQNRLETRLKEKEEERTVALQQRDLHWQERLEHAVSLNCESVKN